MALISLVCVSGAYLARARADIPTSTFVLTTLQSSTIIKKILKAKFRSASDIRTNDLLINNSIVEYYLFVKDTTIDVYRQSTNTLECQVDDELENSDMEGDRENEDSSSFRLVKIDEVNLISSIRDISVISTNDNVDEKENEDILAVTSDTGYLSLLSYQPYSKLKRVTPLVHTCIHPISNDISRISLGHLIRVEPHTKLIAVAAQEREVLILPYQFGLEKEEKKVKEYLEENSEPFSTPIRMKSGINIQIEGIILDMIWMKSEESSNRNRLIVAYHSFNQKVPANPTIIKTPHQPVKFSSPLSLPIASPNQPAISALSTATSILNRFRRNSSSANQPNANPNSSSTSPSLSPSSASFPIVQSPSHHTQSSQSPPSMPPLSLTPSSKLYSNDFLRLVSIELDADNSKHKTSPFSLNLSPYLSSDTLLSHLIAIPAHVCKGSSRKAQYLLLCTNTSVILINSSASAVFNPVSLPLPIVATSASSSSSSAAAVSSPSSSFPVLMTCFTWMNDHLLFLADNGDLFELIFANNLFLSSAADGLMNWQYVGHSSVGIDMVALSQYKATRMEKQSTHSMELEDIKISPFHQTSSSDYLLIAGDMCDSMLYQVNVSHHTKHKTKTSQLLTNSLSLPSFPLSSPNSSSPFSLHLLQRFINIGPIFDSQVLSERKFTVNSPSIIAATGSGAKIGSVRLFRQGVGVSCQSKSTPDFALSRSLTTISLPSHSIHHSLLICSFLSSTRLLSLSQSSITDITDTSLLSSEEETLASSAVRGGRGLLQITATGIRVILLDSSSSIISGSRIWCEWKCNKLEREGKEVLRIVKATIAHDCVLAFLMPIRVLVLLLVTESINGQCCINESASISLESSGDVSALHITTDPTNENSSNRSPPNISSIICLVGTHSSHLLAYKIPDAHSFSSLSSSSSAASTLSVVFSLSLSSFTNESESTVPVPESIICIHSPSFSLLLIGMRDGSMLRFHFSSCLFSHPQSSTQTNDDITTSPSFSLPSFLTLPQCQSYGLLPLQLIPFNSVQYPNSVLALTDQTFIFSLSTLNPLTQPLIIIPICYSFTLLQAAPFFSSISPSGIIAIVGDCMHILSLHASHIYYSPSIQSLPSSLQSVTTYPMNDTPRRLLIHSTTNTLIILSSNISHNNFSVEVHSLSAPGNEIVRWNNWKSKEIPCSINTWSFKNGEELICIGTSEEERNGRSKGGRLLVFKLQTKESNNEESIEFKLISEVRFTAGVSTITPYSDSYLLVSATSSIYLLSSNDTMDAPPLSKDMIRLVSVCEYECRYHCLATSVANGIIHASIAMDGIIHLHVVSNDDSVIEEEKKQLPSNKNHFNLINFHYESAHSNQETNSTRSSIRIKKFKLVLKQVDSHSRHCKIIVPFISQVTLPSILQSSLASNVKTNNSNSFSTGSTLVQANHLNITHTLGADIYGHLFVVRVDPLSSLTAVSSHNDTLQQESWFNLGSIVSSIRPTQHSSSSFIIVTLNGSVYLLSEVSEHEKRLMEGLSHRMIDHYSKNGKSLLGGSIAEYRRLGGSKKGAGMNSIGCIEGDFLKSFYCLTVNERSTIVKGWKDSKNEEEITLHLERVWQRLNRCT